MAKERQTERRRLEDEQKRNARKEVFSWVRMFATVIVVVFVLTHFIIINAKVPSGSMENTIMTHDRLIGFRFAYWFDEPQRGDIILFEYPVDEKQTYIKRVIGLPGETVEIRDGHIYIDGSEKPLEEDYLKFNSYDPLVSYQLGFHAEYTTSRKILEAVADLAHKYKAPVFTHNSETKGETEGCLERYGMTPTAFLDSLGMFEYGGGGYHCVHITDEDMDIFKKHDMTIVTNPGSNVKLASGIPRLNRMLEKGVRLAIGTDGPASNNCLDMFREMFLVTGLTKLRENDASAMPAEEVLKMACVGGAYAMGLTDCDCIQKGKLADLVLIDLHQPNMQPVNNIVKNLVYSGSKQNVKLVMIDGTVRYEDGTFFIGEDSEEVYRRANAIIERMRQEA